MPRSIESDGLEVVMAYRSFRRIYPRYQVQYPVIFGWASCVGEGRLTNLSFSGCSVLCDRAPLVGEEVRVSVLLPDQMRALSIKNGTIKWAEGHQFGVEFLCLPSSDRQRLNRTLREALIHRLKNHTIRTTSLTFLSNRTTGGHLDIFRDPC